MWADLSHTHIRRCSFFVLIPLYLLSQDLWETILRFFILQDRVLSLGVCCVYLFSYHYRCFWECSWTFVSFCVSFCVFVSVWVCVSWSLSVSGCVIIEICSSMWEFLCLTESEIVSWLVSVYESVCLMRLCLAMRSYSSLGLVTLFLCCRLLSRCLFVFLAVCFIWFVWVFELSIR